MNFPLSEIDVKAYNDKIYDLIQDEACVIFIDTNIIALLYGIHDTARKEFLDWMKLYIVKDRVKVPHWVVNEYTNRFIRDKIQDYLNPLSMINTIKKEFKHASAFLKMNIDLTSLKNSAYHDVAEFHKELKLLEEKINNIANVAASKDKGYKLRIHKEIETIFRKCVLDCDIETIINKVNNSGGIRYNHKIPPGFQDEKKELNSFGDLILWHEILEYCKNTGNKKAILLTNDEKKDWVYAPNKLIINSKTEPNKEPLYKIVDPRLVSEYKTYTNSEEFHIINFEQLTKILIGKLGNEFIELASALQIVHNQINDQSDDSTANTEATENNVVQVAAALEEATQHHKESLVFSELALKDKDYPLHEESILVQTIEKLKSYSWYEQNPAIDNFTTASLKPFDENTTNSDSLFVVGRNIYQAAHGGSNAAIDFIRNMRDKFAKYNDYFINNLYAGIFYEIYFNSKGEFRGDDLKAHFASEVFKLREVSRLKPAMEFIMESLKRHKEDLVYFPFDTKPILIEFNFDEELHTVNDSWFGERSYIGISSITINGKDVLSENPRETFSLNLNDTTMSQVIETICQQYAIPLDQISAKSNFPKYNETIIYFENKNLKKFSNLKKS
jgi:hypothetical protein